MRLTGAELVESREILPGTWLQSWHAPAIVSGARAGQYVHVRTTEAGGLPLRRIRAAEPVRQLAAQGRGRQQAGQPDPVKQGGAAHGRRLRF